MCAHAAVKVPGPLRDFYLRLKRTKGDNKAIVAKTAALRVERAQLLGYKTYADFVIEENMAKTPDKVYALLNQLWTPARTVALKEAADMQAMIRWLISAKEGAPNFAMRVIEIKRKGEKIPLHHHGYEHEIFVIEGQGTVTVDGETHDVRVGDVVYVPPGAQHQYVNTGGTPFKFLCGIPTPRLQTNSTPISVQGKASLCQGG